MLPLFPQRPFHIFYITVYLQSLEMVALLEWWSGTECSLYTDPKSFPLYGKENAIVVLNHNFEIDFLCGWTFCERFGVLGVRDSLTEIYAVALFFSPIGNLNCLSMVISLLTMIYLVILPPELEGVSQKTVELCTHYWLDVVLPGDRFLPEEVGGGPTDCG